MVNSKIEKAQEKIKKLKKKIKANEDRMNELYSAYEEFEFLDCETFNLGVEIGDLKFKIKEWKKK